MYFSKSLGLDNDNLPTTKNFMLYYKHAQVDILLATIEICVSHNLLGVEVLSKIKQSSVFQF